MKTILIVEDESTSRKIIRLALEGGGRDLVFAADGESAVDLAREIRPDLILMDVMLPRINGFEAARLIREEEGLAEVPILAITARTMTYDRQQAKEAGCVDYITKPFRLADLRTRVESFLSG